MEYLHAVFMFKVKQDILHDPVSERRLKLIILWNIYFTKFETSIRYDIILWGGERERVKVLVIQKKGFFIQLRAT